MDDRYKPDADSVARARNLIARAAKGVEHLERATSQAFCRLTALVGMLARLEKMARSRDSEAVDAALLDAATVCREAELLLGYLDSRQRGSVGVAASGRDRTRSSAGLGGRLASGG